MKNNKKRSIPFTSIQDINKRCKNRKIILFGVGSIASKTCRILNGKKIDAVIDNASNLWGEFDQGVEVFPPEYLLKNNKKSFFVIICTTSFVEVADQLEGMGFLPENDFYVSPILNDLRIIDELETIEKTILFTSGSPPVDTHTYGGGVYELKVKQDIWNYKKVISGNCYGLIPFKDHFISVDTELGIFEFDQDYKIVRSKPLPKGMRAHGVDFSKKHDCFFVVGSHRDAVLILDKNFNVMEEIEISNKKEQSNGEPQHHCNDCLVIDDSLFVSMFSASGNWRKGVFDGAILEYDIERRKVRGKVIDNLWMPHNIKFIEGSIHVLNSLQGQLRANNAQIIGQFPAFTRGLDYDGVFYFIGQSKNRNYSKNIGVSLNISIDAGIIVFDSNTKVSRLLQLPPKMSEIHSILLLN